MQGLASPRGHPPLPSASLELQGCALLTNGLVLLATGSVREGLVPGAAPVTRWCQHGGQGTVRGVDTCVRVCLAFPSPWTLLPLARGCVCRSCPIPLLPTTTDGSPVAFAGSQVLGTTLTFRKNKQKKPRKKYPKFLKMSNSQLWCGADGGTRQTPGWGWGQGPCIHPACGCPLASPGRGGWPRPGLPQRAGRAGPAINSRKWSCLAQSVKAWLVWGCTCWAEGALEAGNWGGREAERCRRRPHPYTATVGAAFIPSGVIKSMYSLKTVEKGNKKARGPAQGRAGLRAAYLAPRERGLATVWATGRTRPRE